MVNEAPVSVVSVMSAGCDVVVLYDGAFNNSKIPRSGMRTQSGRLLSS